MKEVSLRENFNVWHWSRLLSSILEVASKPLTCVGETLRDRDLLVEPVRRSNMANIESQPLYILEAGDGK